MASNTNITFIDYQTIVPAAWLNNVNAYFNAPTVAAVRLMSKASSTVVLAQGYYKPFDGGGGVYILDTTDTSSADNGGTILVAVDGGRWKLQYNTTISIKQFGATGNGTTDDTAAIQACFTALASLSLSVYIPEGTYLVSSLITITNTNVGVWGAGANAILKTTSASAGIFSFTGSQIECHSLQFASSVTQTAGAYITVTVGYAHIHDIFMNGFYVGVLIPASPVVGSTWISHTRMFNGVANSIGISVNSGIDIAIDNCLITGNSGLQLAAGIQVTAAGDTVIRRTQVIYGGNGLSVSPASGQTVELIMVDNCEFDSCQNNAVSLLASGTGTIQQFKATQNWFSTSLGGNGLALNTSGSGTILQVDCVNCIMSNNAGNGVAIPGTGVSNVSLIDCTMSANALNGINVPAAVNGLIIMGCTVGPSGQFVQNLGWGMIIGSGVTNCSIIGNRVLSNNSGSIELLITSGFGTTVFVSKNQGFVTQNSGTLTTTAGPTSFTFGHGLAVTPAVQNVTLTAATSSVAYWVSSLTSANITITFASAPGAGVVLGWAIRSVGS